VQRTVPRAVQAPIARAQQAPGVPVGPPGRALRQVAPVRRRPRPVPTSRPSSLWRLRPLQRRLPRPSAPTGPAPSHRVRVPAPGRVRLPGRSPRWLSRPPRSRRPRPPRLRARLSRLRPPRVPRHRTPRPRAHQRRARRRQGRRGPLRSARPAPVRVRPRLPASSQVQRSPLPLMRARPRSRRAPSRPSRAPARRASAITRSASAPVPRRVPLRLVQDHPRRVVPHRVARRRPPRRAAALGPADRVRRRLGPAAPVRAVPAHRRPATCLLVRTPG
jgi:hypothetical protein